MLISWDRDKPVKCSEHGWLAEEPLSSPDSGILAIEHLRDVHGLSADEASSKIAKVQAHQAKQQ